MGYETIICQEQDGIGTITLNRPERRNALSLMLIEEMMEALGEIVAHDDLRAVVITGGAKCFSAGADLRDILQAPSSTFIAELRDLLGKIENFDWPVIAAINGHCIGGGCLMAMCCDLRVAADDATFGFPEIRFGSLVYGGATQKLTRMIGLGKAKEMLYTGDPIDSREAYRLGLLNKVVPPESVVDEAKRMARALTQRPPAALKMMKLLVDTGMGTDPNTLAALEDQLSKMVYASGEAFREGMKKAAEREDVYKRIID